MHDARVYWLRAVCVCAHVLQSAGISRHQSDHPILFSVVKKVVVLTLADTSLARLVTWHAYTRDVHDVICMCTAMLCPSLTSSPQLSTAPFHVPAGSCTVLPWSDCMHALTAHDVVWRDMTVMMCVWGMPRCNSSKFHDVMVQQGHPHKLRPVYHAIERYFT